MTSISKIILACKAFSACSTLSLMFLFVASANADGSSDIEQLTAAGTFLTSRLDANADGAASSWCTLQIRGGYQGSSTQQCINEDVFAGFTSECPGGRFVVNGQLGGTGVGTRTFPNAEDQIYFQLTERELCANAFGQFTGQDAGVIVGGTGRYEGATGSFEWKYSGRVQYFDPAAVPPQQFGSLTATGTWDIQRPD